MTFNINTAVRRSREWAEHSQGVSWQFQDERIILKAINKKQSFGLCMGTWQNALRFMFLLLWKYSRVSVADMCIDRASCDKLWPAVVTAVIGGVRCLAAGSQRYRTRLAWDKTHCQSLSPWRHCIEENKSELILKSLFYTDNSYEVMAFDLLLLKSKQICKEMKNRNAI